MSDLWPDNLADIGNLQVPSMILKEQADILAKKTRNILEGNVFSSTDRDSEDPHQIIWHFQIFSPALRYSYELFSITHNVELYPVCFFSDDPEIATAGQLGMLSDEQELIALLRRVFSTGRTLRIIKSLVAQSISLQPKPTQNSKHATDNDDIPF